MPNKSKTRTYDSRWERLRELLVRKLQRKGINNVAVLDAMRKVPRELFVPRPYRKYAYLDRALPIESGQTISQPYIVAMMACALDLCRTDTVLDVGTGSGYAAAVTSMIVDRVFGIERDNRLARQSRKLFSNLNYKNIQVKQGDGSLGWPEHAPFNAISVAAAAPTVPEQLLQQLAVGGRMVIPLGEPDGIQMLIRIIRTGANCFDRTSLGEVRFVPFISDLMR